MDATQTTDTYTLSLHDALPIWRNVDLKRVLAEVVEEAREAHGPHVEVVLKAPDGEVWGDWDGDRLAQAIRSEEHTSELQSQSNLVCRLLLEKKNVEVPRPVELT